MKVSRYFSVFYSTLCYAVLSILYSVPAVSSFPLNNVNTSSHGGCQRIDTSSSSSSSSSSSPSSPSVCAKWYQYTQLPNVFGHDDLLKAVHGLDSNLGKVIGAQPSDQTAFFLCVLYLPPCTVRSPSASGKSKDRFLPLPCRSSCEEASANLPMQRDTHGRGTVSQVLPIFCHTLPTQTCYRRDGHSNSLTFVRRTAVNGDKAKLPAALAQNDRPAISKSPPSSGSVSSSLSSSSSSTSSSSSSSSSSSVNTEPGDSDTSYDLEVVSFSDNGSSGHQGRRYDITDFGDPELFHGWADVQGTGAANDYCRVIGKSRRKFLSCNLAGSQSQGHHYVSRLGFDLGYKGTWFMRDMDGDGRDDYCRCVGAPKESRVTCMKAGEKGFHGSPMQRGSQHSFVLASSSGCHNKRVNAMFGE